MTASNLPPCGPGGPTVRVTIVGRVPGKPPVYSLFANIHVANPLSRVVWMIFNASDGPPASLSKVDVSSTAYADPSQPRVFVWGLFGSRHAKVIPIASNTAIVLRDVALSTTWHAKELWIGFADQFLIDGQQAMKWLGQEGIAPTSGEFSMRTLEWMSGKKVEAEGGVPLTLRMLCSQRVEVDRPY